MKRYKIRKITKLTSNRVIDRPDSSVSIKLTANEKPKSPNIAPEAPTETVNNEKYKLPIEPARPQRKYTNKNFPEPIIGSKPDPTEKRPYMFNNKWRTKPCRNMCVI